MEFQQLCENTALKCSRGRALELISIERTEKYAFEVGGIQSDSRWGTDALSRVALTHLSRVKLQRLPQAVALLCVTN